MDDYTIIYRDKHTIMPRFLRAIVVEKGEQGGEGSLNGLAKFHAARFRLPGVRPLPTFVIL